MAKPVSVLRIAEDVLVLDGAPRGVVVGRALPHQGGDVVLLPEDLVQQHPKTEQLDVVDARQEHAALVVQELPK